MTWIKSVLLIVAVTSLVACSNENTEKSSVPEESTAESTEVAVEEPATTGENVEATQPTEKAPVKAVISNEPKAATKATKTEENVAPKKSAAKTLTAPADEEAPATTTERRASE